MYEKFGVSRMIWIVEGGSTLIKDKCFGGVEGVQRKVCQPH